METIFSDGQKFKESKYLKDIESDLFEYKNIYEETIKELSKEAPTTNNYKYLYAVHHEFI